MAASASTKTAVGRRVSPASLLGVEPAELMLVAAHPWDLNGACAARLQTAFIERPLEFGSDSPVYEDPGADVSAADLHELAQRLAN